MIRAGVALRWAIPLACLAAGFGLARDRTPVEQGCPCCDAAPDVTPPPPPAPRLPPARIPRVVEVDDSLPSQLTDTDVLDVLRANRVPIRDCLLAHRASTSSLEGRMTVKLLIQRSGAPSRVSVSPAKYRESDVGRCVAREVETWRFGAFNGPSMPVDFPVTVRR